MGVKGTTRILQDVGWLPNDDKEDSDDNDETAGGARSPNGGNGKATSRSQSTAASQTKTCGCSTSVWRQYDPRAVIMSTVPQEEGEDVLPTTFVIGKTTTTTTTITSHDVHRPHERQHQQNLLPPLRRIFPPIQVATTTKKQQVVRLLIDGNGLAFYLHSIAYARYVRSLMVGTVGAAAATTETTSSRSCPTIRQLEKATKKVKNKKRMQENSMDGGELSKIANALPCMLPLSILREVTTEFIDGLCQAAVSSTTTKSERFDRQQHSQQLRPDQLHIDLFWDGKYRPAAKAATDAERRERRIEEESNLEMFCRYGVLPSASDDDGTNTKGRRYKLRRNQGCTHNDFVCRFKDEFPYSKLFLTCVRHAIETSSRQHNKNTIVTIGSRTCTGEADIDLAREASGNPLSYVVALDSDFFFYKDINYIPLNQIAVSITANTGTPSNRDRRRSQETGIFAFVARRDDLAHRLGLHDSQMIELALLMGNDYVNPAGLVATATNGQQMTVGKNQGRLSTPDIVSHLQENDDFVAKTTKPEDQTSIDFVRRLYDLNLGEGEDVDFIKVNEALDCSADETRNDSRSLQLTPQDSSLRDALIRHLECCLDKTDDEYAIPISNDALEALRGLWSDQNAWNAPKSYSNRRPTWDAILQANYIERCINQIYKKSADHFLVRATPPEHIFDRLQFHLKLASIRDSPSTKQSGEAQTLNEPVASPPVMLPIDEYEPQIIETIKQNRVTIIHGETGCGKSSRLPIMLLNAPPPDASLAHVKFFISQPRRIAAKGLVERVRSCEPAHKDRFALRMGHGWKEYETNRTRVWFVTTGYLVRLLANHPEKFNDCSHLVVDEVHERSVDTDILCLLCRRLLNTNKKIRLVLMSATLATKLYKDYFGVPNEPIHVGVRRFPIREYFLEDLHKDNFGLPKGEKAAVSAIIKEIESKKCRVAPTSAEMEKRFNLVARLTTIVGEPGASVLVFVPGMAEIVAISEAVDNIHVAGVEYKCFPIHSDVPFEEQMCAFDDPAENEVKVIIATNAAESSVTLPSVDHVICLGLCRQITYNQASHRQMLTPTWISKASATQRAGRTGRVRPGSVYRMYTRSAYEHYMEEFEPGEMVRIPLDSVILLLKQILHEQVKPIFMECLEPPKLETIDRSFQSLYRWNFLTGASDEADITSLGSFVSSLGVDLSLGSLIGLGIQFGLAAEAIEMAAMMSLPKTPFQIASPMWLDAKTFNSVAPKIYCSKSSFDGGLYSEPMALMNAIWDFEMTSKKSSWYHQTRFAAKRWQQAVSSRNSLRKRVADFLGIDEAKLQVQLPPRDMPPAKLEILRVLCVWVFSDSIIECAPSTLKLNHDGSAAVTIKCPSSNTLNEKQLKDILDDNRHPHTLLESNIIEQRGTFEYDGGFSLLNTIDDFEKRLVSYMCEKEIPAAFVWSNDAFFLYLDTKLTSDSIIADFVRRNHPMLERASRVAFLYSNMNRRGIQERSCGRWSVQNHGNAQGSTSNKRDFERLTLDIFSSAEFGSICSQTLRELYTSSLKSTITCCFPVPKKKKARLQQQFEITLRGLCRPISKKDLSDMLGLIPSFVSTQTKASSQSIVFHKPPIASFSKNALFTTDVPEGVRVIATMACSQRRGPPRLRFPIPDQDLDDEERKKINDETIDFPVVSSEVDVSKRWRRLNSDSMVFVEDSVPASAMHPTSKLFAVAANALELQKGGLRVECLTLLPPNPLFLLLSLLSFGLDPDTSYASISARSMELSEDKFARLVKKSVAWLEANLPKVVREETFQVMYNEVIPEVNRSAIRQRLEDAINFNEMSMNMGEKLMCFPDQVQALIKLFDRFDDKTELNTWDTLNEESLTENNLALWRQEHKISHKRNRLTPEIATDFDDSDDEVEVQDERGTHEGAKTTKVGRKPSSSFTQTRASSRESETIRRDDLSSAKSKHPHSSFKNSQKPTRYGDRRHHEFHAVRTFDDRIIRNSKVWFATTQGDFEMPVFPSTNILALVFTAFGQHMLGSNRNDQQRRQDDFVVALDSKNWDIISIKYDSENGSGVMYKAKFINSSVDPVPVFGRGKNKLPKWLKTGKDRPAKMDDARACVPPSISFPVEVVELDGHGLVFKTIYGAVQMESAFWLEKQFCYGGKTCTRHWYDHTIEQMLRILTEQRAMADV